jgi:hypothetical protein
VVVVVVVVVTGDVVADEVADSSYDSRITWGLRSLVEPPHGVVRVRLVARRLRLTAPA